MLRQIQTLYETVRPIKAGDPAINQDVTVVTGYVEIPTVGAGTEASFAKRNRAKYLEWMRAVLSIRQKMVIYIEPANRDFVLDVRRSKGLQAETFVETVDVEELRESRWYQETKRIIDGGYMRHAMRPNRVELTTPMWPTIMFYKMKWVREAIERDPFKTRYFMWMDAGYGHGMDKRHRYRGVVDHVWPSPKKNHLMKDTVLVLGTGLHVRHMSPAEMMTSHNHVLAGGIWGGDRDKLLVFFDRFHEQLNWTLAQNLLDDEQSVMSQVWVKYPELFTTVDCTPRLRDRCYFLKYLDSSGT